MGLRHRLAVTGVALCLIAAGCGESTVDPPPSPTLSTAAAPSPSPSEMPSPSRRVVRYVALGDSLASGMGGEPSYADFYRAALQRRTRLPIELTNLGRPGWTSAQLLEALRTSEMFRSAVAQADVITWDIGGNDLVAAVLRHAAGSCGGPNGLGCLREAAEEFEDHWTAVVDELVELRDHDDVALLTFDLYTPFVFPDARTGPVLAHLGTMNETIAATEGRHGVRVAAVADDFEGSFDELIDDDGLHPSRKGHQRISRLLLGLGVPPAAK